MSQRTRKTYEVLYFLEQGFSVTIEATSEKSAEHIVRNMLDKRQDVLAGSTRGHYDAGIIQCQGVRS